MGDSENIFARFRVLDGVVTPTTRGITDRTLRSVAEDLVPGERSSEKTARLLKYSSLVLTSQSRLLLAGNGVHPVPVSLEHDQPLLPQRLRVTLPPGKTFVIRPGRGEAPAVVRAVEIMSSCGDSRPAPSVETSGESEPLDNPLVAAMGDGSVADSQPSKAVRVTGTVMALLLLGLPVGWGVASMLPSGDEEASTPEPRRTASSVITVTPEDEFVTWVRRRVPGSESVTSDEIIANGQEVCRYMDGMGSPEELKLGLAQTTLSLNLNVQETVDIVVGATRTLCPHNRYLTEW